MTVAHRVTAPGRVNLIGDHTDYNKGVALAVAIDLGTSVELTPNGSNHLTFFTTLHPQGIRLALDLPLDPTILSVLEPPWSRLVGAMIAMVRPTEGGIGRIETTIPVGAGLSSSAALLVALAGALGATGSARSIARLCQQAENFSGVPVGIMDPLVCAGARAGHGMLINFAKLDTTSVPIAGDAELVVVDSGVHRSLRLTEYSARVAECHAAEATVGPLGLAGMDDVAGLRDKVLARRVRHVVTECARVHQVRAALAAGDLRTAGALLIESHHSMANDFEVSTPEVDQLVDHLCTVDGVYGARLTGAGFGGSVVALSRPGAIDVDALPTWARVVVPSDGTVPEPEPEPELELEPVE